MVGRLLPLPSCPLLVLYFSVLTHHASLCAKASKSRFIQTSGIPQPSRGPDTGRANMGSRPEDGGGGRAAQSAEHGGKTKRGEEGAAVHGYSTRRLMRMRWYVLVFLLSVAARSKSFHRAAKPRSIRNGIRPSGPAAGCSAGPAQGCIRCGAVSPPRHVAASSHTSNPRVQPPLVVEGVTAQDREDAKNGKPKWGSITEAMICLT